MTAESSQYLFISNHRKSTNWSIWWWMHNTGYKQNMWLISSITWKKKKSLCSSQEENKILHSIIQFPCKKTQTFSFPANHKFIHYVTAYFDSLVPNKIWVNFQNPTVLWDMQNRWLGGTGRENITITKLHMKIGCIHTVNSIHLCLYHFNYFSISIMHTYQQQKVFSEIFTVFWSHLVIT